MARKILVVDDDPDIVDSLNALLEAMGYMTKATVNGEDSMLIAKDYHPDLILLDFLLSGKDGGYICSRLKGDKQTRNIPVIMISAHPDAKHHALETGANDFLAKPFDIEALEDTIERNLTA